MSNGGKGSRPRPFSVDSETFAKNWDNIFGDKKCDWVYSGYDTGKQSELYRCSICSHEDYIDIYGALDQLVCKKDT